MRTHLSGVRPSTADPSAYETLPYNMSGASDLLITGGQLVLPGQLPLRADVAVNYEDAVARTGGVHWAYSAGLCLLAQCERQPAAVAYGAPRKARPTHRRAGSGGVSC